MKKYINEIKHNKIMLGLGIFIIIISGILIILFSIVVIYQQTIMNEQRQIMDENRQWVEKIPFYEVTGGLGDQIIEGEKIYNEALAKYSAALQTQILAILLLILLSITLITTIGFLIIKFS
ncbi:MAG: hypothetical protein ACFE9I_00035 [Candidatus Hermodarchaeota archaeon]